MRVWINSNVSTVITNIRREHIINIVNPILSYQV